MKIIFVIIVPILIIYYYYRFKKRSKVKEEARLDKIYNKRVKNWQALINSEEELKDKPKDSQE